MGFYRPRASRESLDIEFFEFFGFFWLGFDWLGWEVLWAGSWGVKSWGFVGVRREGGPKRERSSNTE